MFLGNIPSNCDDQMPYTGIGNCPKKMGKIVGVLLTPKTAKFSIDKDEFISGIEAGVYANGSARLFPIKGVTQNEVEGGEANIIDVGDYGKRAVNGYTAKTNTLQIEGGDCLYKGLMAMNGKDYRAFLLDDEGMLYGTIREVSGTQYFVGYSISVAIDEVQQTGGQVYSLRIRLLYSADYINEAKNRNAIEVNDIPDGLVAAKLVAGTTLGTVRVVEACSGSDITGMYAEDWSLTSFIDKSGTNPTDVAYDEATGYLTLAPTKQDYRLAPAKILSASNIIGIDGLDQFTTIL